MKQKSLTELKEEWNKVIDEMEKRQDQGLSTEDLVKKRDKLQKQIDKKEKSAKMIPFSMRIDPAILKIFEKKGWYTPEIIRAHLEKISSHSVCPVCGGKK